MHLETQLTETREFEKDLKCQKINQLKLVKQSLKQNFYHQLDHFHQLKIFGGLIKWQVDEMS
jgi:hypothetical protein